MTKNNDTAKDDGLGDYVRRIYKIVRTDDNGGYEDSEDVRSVLKELRREAKYDEYCTVFDKYSKMSDNAFQVWCYRHETKELER